MRSVPNNDFFKIGQIIHLKEGRWRGYRKILAILPCTSRCDNCGMDYRWLVVESLQTDDWTDPIWKPEEHDGVRGVTFCYSCLPTWEIYDETNLQ